MQLESRGFAFEPPRTPGAGEANVSVCFAGDARTLRTPVGCTLRAAAEAVGLPIGAGCGQADCCGDVVHVLEGAENLEPPGDEERRTLARLGAAPQARLACRARVLGPVAVALVGAAVTSIGRIGGGTGGRVDNSVRQVVIVGNGVAGSTSLERILALSPGCHITQIGEEPRGFYNRMEIARLIGSSESADSLAYASTPGLSARAVDQRIATRVRAIDPSVRSVVLANGERIGYDRLLLATGAGAARPPVAGSELAGCFDLRTAVDAAAIHDRLRRTPVEQVVVIGAGVQGLEAAEALALAGVPVQVLEAGPNPMPAQLLPDCAAAVSAALARRGVRVRAGVQVAAIEAAADDAGQVGAVKLADGESIPAGLVLFCTGTRPNIALARDAGLACGHGILVNAQMRTSDPDIFAAGDVAELDGQVTGLWEPAREQALAAADNMLGLRRVWRPALLSVRGKLKSLALVTLGALPPAAMRGAEIVLAGAGGRSWRQLVLDKDGRVAAAAFVNAPRWIAEVEAAARSGADLRPLLESLQDGRWAVLRGSDAVAA
jgi:NADPH-dependent 2,4-dienoyl-CoA reductase/sulfur reductase-like enzyme/ferredoxin